MFIYKITCGKKSYIGLDTYPSYKMKRWKEHCKNSSKKETALQKAMSYYGTDHCSYEIVEEGFDNIIDLLHAEIKYIKHYDTYNNGLNSTPGGDAWNHRDLLNCTDEEVAEIKARLSETLREYNIKVKWAGLSPDERKEHCAHLHTEDVYQKKSESLKKTYEMRPELREKKAETFRAYWKNLSPGEAEQRKESNRRNSQLGAAKVSKKIKVQFASGEVKLYNSKSEYAREYGYDLKAVLKKTQEGTSHNGKRAWEQ